MDEWKIFGKSNPTIALRVYNIKEREIYPGYISENIILLMIPNEEKEGWHFLAVKKFTKEM